MANKVVGSLMIMLGLDSVGVKRGVNDADFQFRRLERRATISLGSISAKAKGLITQISGVQVAMSALSIGGLSMLMSRSIDTADQIAKLSTRIGISTVALSEYAYAAELSGVSFRNFALGLQRMTRRVAEAAQGTGEAKKAIRELGVDAQWLASLAPEQQFEVLANQLSKVGDQSDRVRIAFKLFDSEGVGLLQMMKGGAEGLRQMREEASTLGLTLDKETAQNAERVKNALSRLKSAGTALGNVLLREFGPALADVTNWLAVHLPRGVDYARGAFLGLKGVAEIIIGKLSWLLGRWYSMFGKLPFAWAEQWRQMAKDFDGFAKFMEERVDKTTAKIGELKLFQPSGRSTADIIGAPRGGASLPFDMPPGGVPFAGDNQNKSLQDALDRQLETVRRYLLSVDEAAFESFAERQFILEEAAENNLITEQKKYEYLLALTKKYEAERTKETVKGAVARNRYTALLQAKGVKDTLRGLQILTAGVANQNRTLFEINKASGIAEATINAYQAFNKSLAQGGLFGYAKAAAIFATAIANVQAISSTSFGGTGSAATPSTSTSVSGPGYVDYVEPETTGGAAGAAGTAINIYISALGDESVKDAVVEALDRAIEYDEVNFLVAK